MPKFIWSSPRVITTATQVEGLVAGIFLLSILSEYPLHSVGAIFFS